MHCVPCAQRRGRGPLQFLRPWAAEPVRWFARCVQTWGSACACRPQRAGQRPKTAAAPSHRKSEIQRNISTVGAAASFSGGIVDALIYGHTQRNVPYLVRTAQSSHCRPCQYYGGDDVGIRGAIGSLLLRICNLAPEICKMQNRACTGSGVLLALMLAFWPRICKYACIN